MPTKSTFLIYYIFLTLQLAYGILSWYLIYAQGMSNTLGGKEVIYLSALLIIASAAAAWFIDSSRAKQAIKYRLNVATGHLRYRTTVLLRLSLVQAANVMVLTLAVAARRIDIMSLLVPGLLIFIFFRPNKSQFGNRYR